MAMGIASDIAKSVLSESSRDDSVRHCSNLSCRKTGTGEEGENRPTTRALENQSVRDMGSQHNVQLHAAFEVLFDATCKRGQFQCQCTA